MKILFIVCLLSLFCLNGFAQQDPLYAQYLNNPLLLNPAYTGSNQRLQSTAAYRTQWSGFDGNPTTFNFSSHLSVAKNKVGLGIIAVQDKIGEIKNTEFSLNYSYRIESEKNAFYFGLNTGFIRYNADPGLLSLKAQDDPTFVSMNEFQFNTGAGLMIKNDRFLIGLSVPKLLPTRLNQGDASVQVYNQHFYLFGSYVHNVNDRFMFKPSLLLRGTKGAFSADVNLNGVIDQNYTIGLLTRNFSTAGLLLQVKMKEYRLGYVLEIPSNRSVGQRFTSHEISLTYSIPIMNEHDHSMFFNF